MEILEVCVKLSTAKLNPALWTPAKYRHLIITDSSVCPWGKKAVTFSLNSTRLIWTLSILPSVSI